MTFEYDEGTRSISVNTTSRDPLKSTAFPAFDKESARAELAGNAAGGRTISTNGKIYYLRGGTAGEKTPVVDLIVDHNQTLDTIDKALKQGIIRDKFVFVHVDSHSDIYLNAREKETVADYVNSLFNLTPCPVREAYWVVPDSRCPVATQLDRGDGVGPLMLDKEPPYDVTVEGGAVVHIVREDQLPDFRGQKDIVLDIDEDYFSSGISNPDRRELDRRLRAFGVALESRNLNPDLVVVCKSPVYTGSEDMRQIEEYLCPSSADYIRNTTGNYQHGKLRRVDTALFDILRKLDSPDLNDAEWQIVSGMLEREGYLDIKDLYDGFRSHHLSCAEFKNQLEKKIQQIEDRSETDSWGSREGV